MKYTYTIRTDADMIDIEATDIHDAARQWAAQEAESVPHLREELLAISTAGDLFAYIESIDGAWLWIESDDAPDGNRQYAGEENMA